MAHEDYVVIVTDENVGIIDMLNEGFDYVEGRMGTWWEINASEGYYDVENNRILFNNIYVTIKDIEDYDIIGVAEYLD